MGVVACWVVHVGVVTCVLGCTCGCGNMCWVVHVGVVTCVLGCTCGCGNVCWVVCTCGCGNMCAGLYVHVGVVTCDVLGCTCNLCTCVLGCM